MTKETLIAILHAQFNSKGIVYADAETGERMFALRESSLEDLAELIIDVFPESWEERTTQEIPRITLDALREESR